MTEPKSHEASPALLKRLLIGLSWGLPLPLLLLNGWVALQFLAFFKEGITALVTATLLSFLIAYPIQNLRQRFGLRKPLAVLLVVIVFLLILSLLSFTLIPFLLDQVTELTQRFPGWIRSSSTQIQSLDLWLSQHRLPLRVDSLAAQLETSLLAQAQALSSAALQLFPAALGEALHWILVLMLTLYSLLHGDRFWNGLFRWLPPWGQRLRQVTAQTFHNYFIGQLILATIVATVMTIAFLIIRVPFALVFGLGVGLLALFPLGKTLGVVIVSIIVSLKSIWLGVRVAAVAIVLDQLTEYLVSPLLMSRFTALNPIWVLLSLIVGAKLGGLLGLVLAVPLAGSIKAFFEEPAPEKSLPHEPPAVIPSDNPP